MGSLCFISQSKDAHRSISRTLAEAEFADSDGITVIVNLDTDKSGELFKLEVWKVDYSPVRKYPELEGVTIKRI